METDKIQKAVDRLVHTVLMKKELAESIKEPLARLEAEKEALREPLKEIEETEAKLREAILGAFVKQQELHEKALEKSIALKEIGEAAKAKEILEKYPPPVYHGATLAYLKEFSVVDMEALPEEFKEVKANMSAIKKYPGTVPGVEITMKPSLRLK